MTGIVEIKEFIISQVNTNEFFKGGLLISMIGYLGYALKNVPSSLWQLIRRRIIYTVTINQTDELYVYLQRYLRERHHNSYKNVEATLNELAHQNDKNYAIVEIPASNEYSDNKTNKPDKNVYYNHYTDRFFIFYNGWFLSIQKEREKFENANSFSTAYYNKYTISGIFAKRKINRLLNNVIIYNKKFEVLVPNLYTNNVYGEWIKSGNIRFKDFNTIFFEGKENLIDDLEEFKKSEKFYRRLGLPYKRGYMFHGNPGNGKTSTGVAMANWLGRDVYTLNLNNLDDDGVKNAFNYIKDNSVLLIEDIDCLFDNERNKRDTKKIKANFSTLLNCMDGVFSKDNIITVITTNNPDKLDSALIRDGRIDFKFEFKNPGEKQILDYLKYFYENKDIKIAGIKNNILSMAEIQGICIKNKNNPKQAITEIKNKNK